jgi:hypothetical protein
VELVGTRVVGLVVELDRPDGDRVEAGLPGVRVAQAGAGHRQLEHLDHLGPQGAGKGPVAADGGLAGDAALLVGGSPQRQIGGRLQQAVPGLHAVPGGQDVGEVGAHVAVDPDGPAHPSLDPGGHS